MEPISIKVEHDLPLPKRGGWKCNTYPWHRMKEGSSFEFGEHTPSRARNLLSAACNYCKKRGLDWKFTTRDIDGKLRIWRIK